MVRQIVVANLVILYATLILLLCLSIPSLTFAAETVEQLEEKLLEYVEANKTNDTGLSTIIVHEAETIQHLSGYADIEKKIAVDEDTVFEWASVSKILIWISLFQLAEEGKVDLDAKIDDYLPNDFHYDQQIETPIKIRDLMHHTAGFDDRLTDLIVVKKDLVPPLRKVLEDAQHIQVYPPGEVVAYSNYGSALAAYIVERVSGHSYDEYVRKNIFQPLEMSRTTMDPAHLEHEWVKEQREKVKGYSTSGKLIAAEAYTVPMYPVGSVVGPVTDLQKLLEALLEENGSSLFQKEETIEQLFLPSLYYPNTTIPRFANGFIHLPSASEHVYGHGGNSKAFSTVFYVDRENKQGVIVLTNVANETTFTLGIPQLVFGDFTYDHEDTSVEDAAKWEGIYEPARKPSRGFSKIYGYLLRSKTKESEQDGLMINEVHYNQLSPHVYHTKEEANIYSVDVYHEHPQLHKMLSNTYTDLIYIPSYKHFLQSSSLIASILAMIVSIVFIILYPVKKLREKRPFSKLLLFQHGWNLLVMVNIAWIIYQTMAFTSYSAIQPFLIGNVFYMIISLCFTILYLRKHWGEKWKKREKWMYGLTVATVIILSGNILYWEFYF